MPRRKRRISRVAAAAAALLVAGLLRAAPSSGDRACLECHSGGALGKPGMDVDTAALSASTHGRSGLSCTDCHAALAGVKEFPHGDPGKPSCASCHPDAEKAVERSAHRQDDGETPRCWSCHGGHDIAKVSDGTSRVAPLNQPVTCLRCHADPGLAKRHRIEVREPVDAFERSTHYQKRLRGDEAAPSCTTCHGAHDNVSHRDPGSPIARRNVAATCGGCHSEIAASFEASVHGTALAKGNPDVPSCTGCHTEHAIRGPKEAESPVSPTHIAKTCSHCHEDERLAREYGIAAARMRTFTGSYHGAANRFGDSTVANCASCHGAHDILPSSDPRSRIHSSNLTRTCGACHPQAGQNFATGKIHVRDVPEDNYWAWLVKRIYLSMIWSVIGGFVLLILVDLWGRWRATVSAGSRA